MVRYPLMKRVTQVLASILFIITILTVYLAFDFAVTTAVSNNYPTHKHLHREDDMKLPKSTSSFLSSKSHHTSETDHEQHHLNNQERRTRNTKSKQGRVKLSRFHKSKTGVKINHIKKSVKKQRQSLLTTKIIPYKPNQIHV